MFLAQGFDASVETVLSPAMRGYRIWHLATHGVYDETMPEFSGLVFSTIGPDGAPRFGLSQSSRYRSLKCARRTRGTQRSAIWLRAMQ